MFRFLPHTILQGLFVSSQRREFDIKVIHFLLHVHRLPVPLFLYSIQTNSAETNCQRLQHTTGMRINSRTFPTRNPQQPLELLQYNVKTLKSHCLNMKGNTIWKLFWSWLGEPTLSCSIHWNGYPLSFISWHPNEPERIVFYITRYVRK